MGRKEGVEWGMKGKDKEWIIFRKSKKEGICHRNEMSGSKEVRLG